MLQIKTIKYQLNAAETFDEKVNAALAEGWTLTKREVLPPADLGDRVAFRMLYAELEREEITEAERCCENCAHYDNGAHQEPCLSCSEDADKWEPAK
jgi:hypothetical protein